MSVEADLAAAAQLVLAERNGRVRSSWDAIRALWWPDSSVETSWFDGSGPGFVEASIARAESGRASTAPIVNRLSPPVTDLTGDRAVVQLPSTTTRWFVLGGAEVQLDSWMRLVYRLERRDDEWRIYSLNAINEGDSIVPTIPGHVPQIEADRLARHRRSYRFLSLFQEENGETPRDDLLGTDRPEQVDALYDEVYTWLAGGGTSPARPGKTPPPPRS